MDSRLPGETRAALEKGAVSFGSVLVANRGEIAVRIIRTCRELGIKSIAVYSEADERAMHRRLADESHTGLAPAPESYLNVGRLRGGDRTLRAEAVHPGYGFLSESAVRQGGRVGRALGRTPARCDGRRRLQVRAELAAAPACRRSQATTGKTTARTGSRKRPIKSATRPGESERGGGGDAGRDASGRLRRGGKGARREAEAAFGDGSLEKLVEDPRHVEVQVLGDRHGNVLHLFEREFDPTPPPEGRRRSPVPGARPDLRESICNAAVRFAREAGYQNAGTVEFLLDGDTYYFLEMNARLQVEHPVTELVTGLDLVQLHSPSQREKHSHSPRRK